MMDTFNVYQAALFNRAPTVGERSPSGEVTYFGYRRVPVVADNGANLHEFRFPECEDDGPVLVTHVALMDGQNCVVAVQPVTSDMARKG